MVKKTVEIKNPTGLHARPAAEFTKVASAIESDVFLEKDGKRVNAKSILGLLTLGISQGDVIDVITDGADEQEGLDKLVDLIENLKDW